MGKYLEADYKVPSFHGAANLKNFEDNSYLLLLPNKKGELIVETEKTSFKIEKPEDIFKAFPSKYNWINSSNSEIDCLFKVLDKAQIFELYFRGETSLGETTLVWRQGKISLIKGNNFRETKFIVNVSPFLREKTEVQSIELLKSTVGELQLLNSLGIQINPVSPAATLVDLVLNENSGPFRLMNSLRISTLRKLHYGYIGSRMESLRVGSIGSNSVVDLVKAHLVELGEVPSLSRTNILSIVEGSTRFFEDAHPGSTYTIEVDIPKAYRNFPPIPQRVGDHIRYPVGLIESTIVSKTYIETLQEDNIPFKIIDSTQVRLRSQEPKDFKDFVNRLIKVEDALAGLKNINPKFLHYTLVGSMLAIHKEVNDSTEYVTSRNYNPLIANTIQARIAKKAWRKALEEDSEVIAVDSVIGRTSVEKPGWKNKGTGDTLVITPYIKDKGGDSKFKDLITKYRDFFSFPLTYPNRRLSLKECWRNPKKIGTLEDTTCHIAPSGQGRGLEIPVTRLGALLDTQIKTNIPNAQEPDGNNLDLPDWLLKKGI
jgi:hypothetical protein